MQFNRTRRVIRVGVRESFASKLTERRVENVCERTGRTTFRMQRGAVNVKGNLAF